MIIHRFWDGKEPEYNDWVENAIRGFHPEITLQLWRLTDWKVDCHQVRREDSVRHASNYARYKALYEYGGLWLDHDVVPLCNLFDATALNWVAGVDRWREGCAMRFEKGHPYLKALIHNVDNAPRSNRRSTEVSGAHLLNRIQSEVEIEPRVLPFDSSGRPTNVEHPIAVHLWATSSKRRTSNTRTTT